MVLLTEENLGFFFSCYKEKEAVERAVANIRTFYTKSPMYLSSDGGLDFSYLENDNTKFVLSPDVLGYVNHPETKDKERLIECCYEFLNRLHNAIEYCQKEYVCYYEPDVLIRELIKIHDNLHLNGSYANEIHTNVKKLILKYNPNNTNSRFGSCGGSIVRSQTLKDIYLKVNEDKSIIKDIVYTDPRVSNCDYLLTVLFSIFGYIYHENYDFIESSRDPNWQNTGHAIVHQFHDFYNENYQGKYINK